MKVFISWSGPRSRLLGEALREWIRDMVQNVECFQSTDDIRAGQRWNSEVNTWLADTDFGVLCVTPENAKAPWLNFEAGALAKRIGNDSRVVPVTLGFQPSALEEPLKQFNGVPADREGMLKLIRSIAEVSSPAVDIGRAFDRWWPDLEGHINKIPATSERVAAPKPPDVTEMFSDIMAALRGLTRTMEGVGPAGAYAASSTTYEATALILSQDEGMRSAVLAGEPAALRRLRADARALASQIRRRRESAIDVDARTGTRSDKDDKGGRDLTSDRLRDPGGR